MSLSQCALAFFCGSFGRVKREFVRPAVITVAIATIVVGLGAQSVLAQQKPKAKLDGMAQAQISATIGKDQAAYHFVAKGNTFGAENARNSLSAEFSPSGVSFRSGNNHWDMALRGYGYGDNLVAAKPASPQANQNRLEYSRAGLTEWYVNGPVGLEQGFTLANAPANPNGKPLTLALELSGNLSASVDDGARGLTLRNNGSVVLRYGGLAAIDANGRDLAASMEVAGNELRFRIDDRGAQYPLTIDPMFQAVRLTNNQGGCILEEAAISVHPDTGCAQGEADDQLGYSVAVSSDGNTVAALAPNAVTGTATPGAVYVFQKPARGWSGCITVGCYNYVARLSSSDFLGAPSSVVMSSDGSTIVILESPIDQVNPGVAYVYVKPSTGWTDATETARISAPVTETDPPCCGFSSLPSSVAVSGDGSTIVLAYTAGADHTQPGQAYVFQRPSTGWATTSASIATLEGNDEGKGSWFGASIAISSDGSTVAVGAPFEFNTSLMQGAIYVFTKPSTGWVNAFQTAKLTSAAGTADLELGGAVAIDGGGRTIASLPQAEGLGSIYVFTEPSTTNCLSGSRICFIFFNWTNTTETAQLSTSAGPILDFPSNALTISGDGSTIIGSNQLVGQGTAYVYIKPSSGWANANETTKVTSTDSAAALFGNALATNNDGTVTVIGARLTTIGSISEEGAAYVFTGSAASPVASVSPSSLNFGQQVVGTTSAGQAVTMTNTGTATLNIASVVASAQFTTTQNCIGSLGPGASCTENVAFAPTALGPATGTLTFTDNDGSVSGSTQQVQLSGTGIVTATSTTVSSSLNPSTYGQAVTFTAVVTNASRVPTGSVTFTDGANVLASSVPLTGGVASITITTLSAGSHSIIASYGGDTTNSFNPSSSAPLAQTVNFATTTTTVTSSVNPSYVNQSVTYTATMASQFGGAMSGNVMFKQGATTIATVTLSLGATQVSFTPTTPYSTAGTYNITAVYSGDTNNIGSTSAVLHQTVKALPILTTTVVTTSGSPSFINQGVTFTATISSTDGVPDSQTVTFYDGATPLGTAMSSSSGVAVFGPWSTLTAKTHTIKATYAGDATFKTSTGSVTQVVTLYPTTTTVTATPNSITFGQNVQLSATVTSAAPGGPTGTVRFAAGTTSLGSAPLSGTTATLNTMKIPAGTTAITATYVTDGISAASSGTTPMSVAQATTTTSVVSSKNPSTAGTSVRFTATVSSATTIPTGSVTFMDGTTTLATANLSGGKASYATTALASGTHDITVVYGGTANIVGSTSAVLVQTVN